MHGKVFMKASKELTDNLASISFETRHSSVEIIKMNSRKRSYYDIKRLIFARDI